jgi:flagellar motor switch protein FliN/FliY
MADTQTQIDPLPAEVQLPPLAGAAAAQAADEHAVPAEGAGASGLTAGFADVSAECDPDGERVRRILQIQVPLMVVLAQRKMAVGDILNICIGSVIEFAKPFDEQLELLVNNRPIAFGNAVKIGEKFGLRIIQVGDVRARIDALRLGA